MVGRTSTSKMNPYHTWPELQAGKARALIAAVCMNTREKAAVPGSVGSQSLLVAPTVRS